MGTSLGIQLTYIGYSAEMIESLIHNNRIQLLSVITNKGILDEERKKVLSAKGIHLYEMNDEKIYEIDEHILSDKVLIYKFGYIIPDEIINKHDFFNIHPGSLDNNRGAHPLRWTILNGEKETYMTLYRITGLDEGFVICEEKIQVKNADYIELDKKMDRKIKKILNCLIDFSKDEEHSGKIILKEGGKYRRKVQEKDYTIDLLQDDFEVVQRKIRSVKDFGGAVIFVNDIKYRVLDIFPRDELGNGIVNNQEDGHKKIFLEIQGVMYIMICELFSWNKSKVIRGGV